MVYVKEIFWASYFQVPERFLIRVKWSTARNFFQILTKLCETLKDKGILSINCQICSEDVAAFKTSILKHAHTHKEFKYVECLLSNKKNEKIRNFAVDKIENIHSDYVKHFLDLTESLIRQLRTIRVTVSWTR